MKSHLLQRLSIVLLLLALLAGQWGWLSHEHQAHDSGQACEVCVASASLSHGLTPAITTLFLPASFTGAMSVWRVDTILPLSHRHILGQRGPPTLS